MGELFEMYLCDRYKWDLMGHFASHKEIKRNNLKCTFGAPVFSDSTSLTRHICKKLPGNKRDGKNNEEIEGGIIRIQIFKINKIIE